MLELLVSLSLPIVLFAIGGGGGSSGGGGGGGGSSSSSSSSSGGSGDGEFSLPGLIFTVIIFVVIWIVIWRLSAAATKALKEKIAKTKAALAVAAAGDIIWEPGSLVTFANDNFIRYQRDWSSFNLDSMKSYMTPEYYQYNMLMMGAIKLAGRQNDVQNPTVTSAEVMEFVDDADNEKDGYTVKLTAHVTDILNDTKSKQQLFSKNLYTTEYHRFKRSGKTWRFAGIDQATANPLMHNQTLHDFANENGYFYSIDWGYLLLPKRGQLFKSGSFGVSDINNHIAGLYKDIIIQLYTYIPRPQQSGESYLIAQTSVPKDYGDIVVRRKKGIFNVGIKGLEKLHTEWGDFNSKYEVFASNHELATSFELLNPKFMEQLQAVPFEVNIEVVDNVVYLYAKENGVLVSDHYDTMLELLKAAFKEMRM